jgi:DNA primase catalytic subunit
MDNYTISKQAVLPRVRLSDEAKKAYAECVSSSEITENRLVNLCDLVCRDFGVSRIHVEFSGTEPHKRKRNGGRLSQKTHGIFVLGQNQRIHIYKYTAARQQVRASKAATHTLLHEIIHYLDYAVLGLTNSIHSSGFYRRIGQLQDLLR